MSLLNNNFLKECTIDKEDYGRRYENTWKVSWKPRPLWKFIFTVNFTKFRIALYEVISRRVTDTERLLFMWVALFYAVGCGRGRWNKEKKTVREHRLSLCSVGCCGLLIHHTLMTQWMPLRSWVQVNCSTLCWKSGIRSKRKKSNKNTRQCTMI